MAIVEDYLALQGKCNDALDSAEMWERKWRKAEADLAASQATVETLWRCAEAWFGSDPDHCNGCKAVHDRNADALLKALGVGEE